ncbi:MAG: hypothetical protein ACREEM_45150, partial [Blastocatellia bacterium]
FARFTARINATRDLLKEMQERRVLGEQEVIKHIQAYANVTNEELKARFPAGSRIDDPGYVYQATKVRYARRFAASTKKNGFKNIAAWMKKYEKLAPIILRKQG